MANSTWVPGGVMQPTWEQNACTSAQADRLMVSNLVCGSGVSYSGFYDDVSQTTDPNGVDSLKVGPGTGAMQSVVQGGGAFILGTDIGCQGTYSITACSSTTITHAAADPANPRRDLVIAHVLDSQYTGSANTWQIEIIQGTAAASPTTPAVPTGYTDYLVLGYVTITAGLNGVIPAGNYVDLRVPYQLCNPAYITATSTTLPANPQPGTIVWETDNKAYVLWNGSAWVGLTSGAVLASKVYAPGSNLNVGGPTYTVLDSNNLAITCVIPPSGKVRLKFNGLVNVGASSNFALAWSTQNSNNANFAPGALAMYDNNSGGTTQMGYETTTSGLTPGSTVTFYLQGCVPSGANASALVSQVPVANGPTAGFYLEAAAA